MNFNVAVHNLRSGAQCIFVPMRGPISVVSIWVKSGSRNDPKGKEGLAHLLEHVLMKSTSKFPDQKARLEKIESLGIEANAYTHKERTGYYHIQLVDNTEESLAILLDGFQNSLLSQEQIDKEKDVILDERASKKEDLETYIASVGYAALWPGSKLGADLFGDENSISSVTRADLADFITHNYSSDQVVFLCVGDLNQERIVRKLEEEYIQRPMLATKQSNRETFLAPIPYVYKERNSDRSMFRILYKTAPAVDSQVAEGMEFLRDCLANTWTSRLNQLLRIENQISYWVAGASDNFSDTGYISFTFSCDATRAHEAVRLALEAIEHGAQALSDEDIEKYKNIFIANTSKNTLTPQQLMWWYSYYVTANFFKTPEQYIFELKNVSPEQVRTLASKYLIKENRSIVQIGGTSVFDELEFGE